MSQPIAFKVTIEEKEYDCFREITKEDNRTFSQEVSVPGFGSEKDGHTYWIEDDNNAVMLFNAKVIAKWIINRIASINPII